MAHPSAAVVVAEGAAPLGSAPSRPFRCSETLRLCRALLAEPCLGAMQWASETCEKKLGLLGIAAAKAFAPSAGPRASEMVRVAWAQLDELLCVVDTLTRIPARLLKRYRFAFFGEDHPIEALRYLIQNIVVLVSSVDRAAALLGLPPYDGGPFACGGLALPGGAR